MSKKIQLNALAHVRRKFGIPVEAATSRVLQDPNAPLGNPAPVTRSVGLIVGGDFNVRWYLIDGCFARKVSGEVLIVPNLGVAMPSEQKYVFSENYVALKNQVSDDLAECLFEWLYEGSSTPLWSILYFGASGELIACYLVDQLDAMLSDYDSGEIIPPGPGKINLEV